MVNDHFGNAEKMHLAIAVNDARFVDAGWKADVQGEPFASIRHCEERTGPKKARRLIVWRPHVEPFLAGLRIDDSAAPPLPMQQTVIRPSWSHAQAVEIGAELLCELG